MKSETAENLLKEIDETIKKIGGYNNLAPEQKSYLAKFLIVYVCGMYEEAIENILHDKFYYDSGPELNRFVDLCVHEMFQNPNIEKIKEILGKFNLNWKQKIEELAEIITTALDSIVNHKNNIAHGQISNISLNEAIEYHKRAVKVIEKVDLVVFGDN